MRSGRLLFGDWPGSERALVKDSTITTWKGAMRRAELARTACVLPDRIVQGRDDPPMEAVRTPLEGRGYVAPGSCRECRGRAGCLPFLLLYVYVTTSRSHSCATTIGLVIAEAMPPLRSRIVLGFVACVGESNDWMVLDSFGNIVG